MRMDSRRRGNGGAVAVVSSTLQIRCRPNIRRLAFEVPLCLLTTPFTT